MLDTLLVQYNPDGSIIYDNNIILSAGSAGRQPFSYVELDMDFCTNVFGTSHHAQQQAQVMRNASILLFHAKTRLTLITQSRLIDFVQQVAEKFLSDLMRYLA